MVVRKFNGFSYSNLTNVTKTQQTINNIPVVEVRYAITDGGELDNDWLVNGRIIDPVGLAILNQENNGLIRTGGF